MGNKRLNPTRQRVICIFTDWLTTFVAFLCFNIFRYYYMGIARNINSIGDFLFSSKLIIEQVFVPILLLFVYWISGYYNTPFQRSRLNEFLLTFYSQLFNSILIYLGALTNDHLYLRSENWFLILILFLLLFSFTYVGRLCVTENMMKRMRSNGIKPRTVIIGTSREAFKMSEKLTDPNNKSSIDLVGFMPFGKNQEINQSNNEMTRGLKIIGGIEELKSLCETKSIDQVIIVPSDEKASPKKILFFLYHLYPYEISIKINPDVFSIITPTIRLQDILGEPFVDLSAPQMTEFSKNVKRTFDVVASVLGLVIISPLFLAVSIAIKISSKGKVIYSQERVGIHRKPFKIYKFRSMVEDAEENGIPRLSSDTDKRITKVGRWMRKYRIDEIPQFWNVLKGDMSLVGPRPEREYFIEQIVKKAPWYTLVLQVRPGITSWGMVKYGYATDVDQMIERNRFDLIYLANMSMAVDFKILIHTVKTVGSGAGK